MARSVPSNVGGGDAGSEQVQFSLMPLEAESAQLVAKLERFHTLGCQLKEKVKNYHSMKYRFV